MSTLKLTDPEIFEQIKKEEQRQSNTLQMIPSENFTSPSVREAVGSVLMHKYAEGKVGERYYEGNEFIDNIEKICINRAKKLFKLPKDWGVIVQALSGSNANLIVYNGILELGDTILSMYLPDGGHLSHGWSWPDKGLKSEINKRIYSGSVKKLSITSKMFNIVQYKVSKKDKLFDYDEIKEIAKKVKPKLIISGGTAYPREINHKKLAEIAHSIKGLYMADIAHEAGLIAAGAMKSPVGFADIVTMTTHKTLRGPRGAIILFKEEFREAIERSIIPGIQGGPFENNIAGIAVCLKEALEPNFKKYAHQILKNAKILAQELKKYNFDIVSGGTDKHLILIDLRNKNILVGKKKENLPGRYIARALHYAGITINKNTVPFETGSAKNVSGIRIGTPTVTTRGMKEKEMIKIAKWINEIVEITKKYTHLEFTQFDKKIQKDKTVIKVNKEIKTLCKRFPLKIR